MKQTLHQQEVGAWRKSYKWVQMNRILIEIALGMVIGLILGGASFIAIAGG